MVCISPKWGRASETITHTGYVADKRWNHPVMAMFAIVTPFIGQCLVFLMQDQQVLVAYGVVKESLIR